MDYIEDGIDEPTGAASPSSDVHDTSHEAPPVQHKRKHQALEDSSSSDSEDNDGHAKAQKVSTKAGRPRATDYDDLSKELILQAATVYRCLLSTEDAFPDLAPETEMVKEAWAIVNEETGLVPLRLMPDIAKIVSGRILFRAILIVAFMGIQIKARGSQARGEIKEKTMPLVEGLFGFDSGHGRKAVAANRTLAEELKRDRGFIYKVRYFFNLSYIDT